MILQISNFDALSLSVTIISFILGIYKGITKSLIWLLGVLLSIYSIIHYRAILVNKMIPYIDNITARHIIAVILILLFFMASSAIIIKIFKIIINSIGLGIVDHILGGLFGIIRGSLILVILIYLISMSHEIMTFMEVNNSTSWQLLNKNHQIQSKFSAAKSQLIKLKNLFV